LHAATFADFVELSNERRVLGSDGTRLVFGSDIVFGLLWAVVLSPVNAGETTDSIAWLALDGERHLVDTLRGKGGSIVLAKLHAKLAPARTNEKPG